MSFKPIYYERKRTRDLLLEYDINIVPPRPRTAGLNIIYPFENLPLMIFSKQLFQLAKQSGFTGTESDFSERFGSYLSGKQVVFDSFINFPENGDINKLYFDIDEKILYSWVNNEYLPINTLLIANTILNCGDATDL